MTFKPEGDVIVARAPGRLDVMGGIADYSGSHVLEFPIAEATLVAIQLNDERELNIVTLLEDESRESSFTMPLSVLDGPVVYETAREFFQRDARVIVSLSVFRRRIEGRIILAELRFAQNGDSISQPLFNLITA